jgi:hypothetical protein
MKNEPMESAENAKCWNENAGIKSACIGNCYLENA